jgi:hypothetical protein
LTVYLKELETSERGEIIRHDATSGRYYFNDPLYLAYAQCLFVPPLDSKRVEMRVLGVNFTVDVDELRQLREEIAGSTEVQDEQENNQKRLSF